MEKIIFFKMQDSKWQYILIISLVFACSKRSDKLSIKMDKVISESKIILNDFSQHFAPKNPIDTLTEYLSNFDFSNCNSIELFLTELYNRDQIYRDSSQFYKKTKPDKSRNFGREFTKMDKINIKILKNSLPLLLQRKDCINKEIEIDAIWLVAHHSNDYKLIKSAQPAVDYAFERGIISKDSYQLYYGRLNRIELKMGLD